MPTSEQKRQKKLAKQRSKDKRKRREQARVRNQLASTVGKMRHASQFPVTLSMIGDGAYEMPGMSTAVIARKLPDHTIAVATFLVDLACLGVKDTFARCVSGEEMTHMVESFGRREPLQKAEPGVVKSLVDQAVVYARHNGFAPHPDLAKSYPIFGDIEIIDANPPFTFGGKNGKPHYVSGPHDTLDRQREIVWTLEQTCGSGNFDYSCLLDETQFYDEEDSLLYES